MALRDLGGDEIELALSRVQRERLQALRIDRLGRGGFGRGGRASGRRLRFASASRGCGEEHEHADLTLHWNRYLTRRVWGSLYSVASFGSSARRAWFASQLLPP